MNEAEEVCIGREGICLNEGFQLQKSGKESSSRMAKAPLTRSACTMSTIVFIWVHTFFAVWSLNQHCRHHGTQLRTL